MSHPEVRQEVEPWEVWACEARCGAVLGAGECRAEDLRGCGAIAWSGGGAVRGNVVAGWCVAVAPCRVPDDG